MSIQGVDQENEKTCVGNLPALRQTLLLKEGDTLILTRSGKIGRPATYDSAGQLLAPARIGVSLPEILERAKSGEPVWFDDGKIGGVIRDVNTTSVSLEITQARPEAP